MSWAASTVLELLSENKCIGMLI
jgi:hypothetical protein